ncbi:MAG: hypothetical protein ACYC7A_11895 [Thermoanaerobaculia bacterium]
MMRRLILSLVFILAPAIAVASDKDRDVLLTPTGTLYSIESVFSGDFEIESASATLLQLTVATHEGTTKTFVPASFEGGWHVDPSLAWDAASETLFVFWQRKPNFLTTELLLSSYRAGEWSKPILIDEDSLKLRFDLGVGVSRFATETNEEGEVTKLPALAVHVIWWEQRGDGELARYAQLAIQNGEIVSIKRADLDVFVDGTLEPVVVPEDFDRDLLRHPVIFENAAHDSVDVIFATWTNNIFHKLQIRPIVQQGVLTEPIGVRLGDFGPPTKGRVRIDPTSSTLSMIATPGGNIAFYTIEDGKLTYVLRRNGVWDEPKSLPDSIASTGIEGLRRLVND